MYHAVIQRHHQAEAFHTGCSRSGFGPRVGPAPSSFAPSSGEAGGVAAGEGGAPAAARDAMEGTRSELSVAAAVCVSSVPAQKLCTSRDDLSPPRCTPRACRRAVPYLPGATGNRQGSPRRAMQRPTEKREKLVRATAWRAPYLMVMRDGQPYVRSPRPSRSTRSLRSVQGPPVLYMSYTFTYTCILD